MAQDGWTERSRALESLIARVGLSDRAAFAELYRETSAYLFGVVVRIQPHRGLAEELLQEVFVSVWRGAQGFDATRAQALTWLTSVARNRAIDSLRRSRPEDLAPAGAPLDDDDASAAGAMDTASVDEGGPAHLFRMAASRRNVRHCVEALSAEQRQCVALAYYHGLSHAEVSGYLARPLGSVKSAIRRALVALRDCLGRVGVLEMP
jgi:RNA polymerase sigma-70 factor (ECF subfamily)